MEINYEFMRINVVEAQILCWVVTLVYVMGVIDFL